MVVIMKLNFTKFKKNITLYIGKKKRKGSTHTHKYIKILQFSSMSFLIFKSLHDRLIINVCNLYLFQQFSFIKNFFLTFHFFVYKGLIYC